MFKITKKFYFEAGHMLTGLTEGHPCMRVHGHSYTVKVILKSEGLNKDGFVQDYGELKPIREWIDSTLDHQNLNDIIPGQTSAENIAKHIFHKFKPQFPFLNAVGVQETKKTWAYYKLHKKDVKRIDVSTNESSETITIPYTNDI